MNELNFDVISLNTRGPGNFMKRKKILNYVENMDLEGVSYFSNKHIACKRTKKCRPNNLDMKGVSNILT